MILNSQIENDLFINTDLIFISGILGLQNNDLSIFYNQSNEVSFINSRTNNVSAFLAKTKRNQFMNKNLFSDINMDFTCENAFQLFNDSITNKVSKLTSFNSFDLTKEICIRNKAFDLHTDVINNDIMFIIQLQSNEMINDNYDLIFSFLTNRKLNELYITLLILYRSMMRYLQKNLTNIIMINSIDSFVFSVSIYLGVNIVINIIVYIYFRYLHINKLNQVFDNLNLLSQVLYASGV